MQLHRARSEVEAADVELVLIGQVTPRQAAHFRERYAPELRILADERRESYRAAGAKIATTTELIGPTSVRKGVAKAVRSGGRLRQGRMIGHPAQLGGALLIAPDGRVVWSHMAENAADNASAEEILAAAAALDD